MDTRRKLKKQVQDMVVMAVLMAAGAAFYYVFIPSQIRLRAAMGGATNFSSRTFPNLLMIALFAVALIGLSKAVVGYVRLKRALSAETAPPPAAPPGGLFRVLVPYIAYAVIVAYCVLFRQIGYIFATLIVPPALMLLLGCRKWWLYLSTYAFAAVIYVVFKVLMNVPLP